MTGPEVAALFQVHPNSVPRWAKQGRIASVKLFSGGGRLYFRAEVEALLRGEQLTPAQLDAIRDELAGGVR